VNDKKIKFLREGLEQILADMARSMPDSPTIVGIGIGVVYIPVGTEGKSTVVSGYRIDECYTHQDSEVLQDIGETFLNHGGIITLRTEPEKGN
jgi:hypothetical protein